MLFRSDGLSTRQFRWPQTPQQRHPNPEIALPPLPKCGAHAPPTNRIGPNTSCESIRQRACPACTLYGIILPMIAIAIPSTYFRAAPQPASACGAAWSRRRLPEERRMIKRRSSLRKACFHRGKLDGERWLIEQCWVAVRHRSAEASSAGGVRVDSEPPLVGLQRLQPCDRRAPSGGHRLWRV